MGSILSLGRQFLHLNGTNATTTTINNNSAITNNNPIDIETNQAINNNPYMDNQFQFTQTNSRLNLINQLMNVNGGVAASSTSASNTPQHPPLNRYQQYQLNRQATNRRRTAMATFGARGRNKKLKANASSNLNDFTNITFASHFYMAGRKFKNLLQQTQTFLFGDQLDLAFVLAHKPACVFPYEAPMCVDAPSHCLQSLVNIRKDTLKLVKVKDALDSNHSPQQYHKTGNDRNIFELKICPKAFYQLLGLTDFYAF